MVRITNTSKVIKMAHIEDNGFYSRTLLLLVTLLSSHINAQSLKTDALMRLANDVKQHYSITMTEGASVHKTSEGNALVAIVSVKKSPSMQRVAQVKAARVAGEYLKGSINKSVTVYENIENESYTFSDEANEDSKTQNATSSSTIEQNVSDKTEKTSEVNFSDKIIHSSLTRVNHMEPLTRFIGEEGSQLFAFYIILK